MRLLINIALDNETSVTDTAEIIRAASSQVSKAIVTGAGLATEGHVTGEIEDGSNFSAIWRLVP